MAQGNGIQFDERQFETIVIGGGQAGLAAGVCLQQQGIDFIILDGQEQIGDAWRKRWDSLKLFTPAEYSGLPEMPFPAPPDHLPTKDEMADYLVAYAERFDLPVQLETWVERLTRDGRSYQLHTNRGIYQANHVVVATGAYQKQRIPAFAADLDPAIEQIPSTRYRNPEQLPRGSVLVVGAGNSGAEIALDVAQSGRQVWLSGPNTGHMKRTILGKDIFWWLWRTLFRVKVDSWLGRRLRAKFLGGGAALLEVSEEDLTAAGITRVERTTGVGNGQPEMADGRTLHVSAIIWATGFDPDFGWIERPAFDEDGYPRHRRGVVEDEPGLYFLGLPFLYRGNSSLIGGVGPDARHLAETVARRMAGSKAKAGEEARHPVATAARL
ncbi:MAG: NAD(P)-binding domain-containing protein [Candidatus Promineifilaceae bacterium]|nr:NAD(P)-binding domain-containing protein [Candidatus Promineifilaceae bacterium]